MARFIMANDTDTLSPQLAAQHPAAIGLVGHAIYKVLKDCTHGAFTLELPSGVRIIHRGPQAGPSIYVAFRRWRGVWRCILDGHLGFARGYIDGDWSTPDLKSVLDFCMTNEALPALRLDRWSPLNLFNRLAHGRRDNSAMGSRRNISAHYDLGNDFYAAWLDLGLNYSSGLFLNPEDSLESAQDNKLSQVMHLLDLKGGEKVLEIGFGWAPLAERLVRIKDCAVTGLTLSAAQLAFAQKRLAKHRDIDLRLADYRELNGRFDRIVAIEMIEAVGEKYWPAFFRKLRACLNEGGNAVLQAITIEGSRFESYKRHPDFIQRYIFPGGMLPTADLMIEHARHAGLKLTFQHDFGESYAQTLAEWRTRFEVAWPHIAALGFDPAFKRMWEFYLAYCQVGFEMNAIDVGLYKFELA
jgi:cyclopropane-fatty-acyl-phospholipid synthase